MAERAGHQNEGDAIFMPAPVGHRTAALYGVGSIGTVIFIITPQILLLYVLTRILQVPAQWAGFALLAPKAIELALDPLIGAVSDRTTSRFGRRWPFMAIGALTFPFAFAALFAPPTFASWPLTLAWVTGIYVLATSAYTIFAVPYIALVGEIAASPAERLRLVAWRMGFVSIGVLIAGAGAPLIAGMSADPRQGYAIAGATLAALCLLVALASTSAAWPYRLRGAARSDTPIFATVRKIFRTRAYRGLWLSYAVQMAGVSANAALLPFAVEYQLRTNEDTVSLIFALMTIATLVAMPAAVVIGRRFGQVTAYIGSLILSGAGVLLFLGGAPGLAAPALLAATLFGVGQAGATAYPFALMPTAAEADDADEAARNAGAFAGAWTAGEKLGLALGGALAAAMLAVIGFKEGNAEQSAGTLAALPWIFAAAPAVIFLLAAAPALALTKSPLNRSYRT